MHNCRRDLKHGKGNGSPGANALKHGILAYDCFFFEGNGAENPSEFKNFLATLLEDLGAVGALEEILVEKIAICCWRQRRVLKCEAGMAVHDLAFAVHKNNTSIGKSFDPILDRTTRHLNLPLSDKLDWLLRYHQPAGAHSASA